MPSARRSSAPRCSRTGTARPSRDSFAATWTCASASQPVAADPEKLAEGLRLSADIQRELWQHAELAAKEAPTPIVATFVTTLNETIDTEAERVAAGRHRIPGTVWLLLLAVASL